MMSYLEIVDLFFFFILSFFIFFYCFFIDYWGTVWLKIKNKNKAQNNRLLAVIEIWVG